MHPAAPAARYDSMGLMLLIRGGTVTTLNATRATILMPNGSVLSYLRCSQGDAVPLWTEDLLRPQNHVVGSDEDR